MEYNQILSDLKNKIYKTIYFLSGEEPYYIDEITSYILNNVLTATEKDFTRRFYTVKILMYLQSFLHHADIL